MRNLITLDEKNYTDDMPVFEKYAVRAVIIKDGKMAMQKAGAGYFKILGGGMDEGETFVDSLAREVQEESGLIIKPDSVQEIGEILEKREDLFEKGKIYICHSCFFFCDVEDYMGQTSLTESEIREDFKLEWAEPDEIIKINEKTIDKPWVDRDTLFIRMLAEGKVSKQ